MKADPDATPSLATATRVLEAEAEAIRKLITRMGDAFLQALDIAVACTGKIAVVGMGKSGLICKKIAATLSSTGSPAYFLHAAEAMHGDVGLLGPSDVVLIVSKSGETAEIYSTGRGFTAGTLRWWASRLRREDPIAGPVVRLAQVVRAPSRPRDEVPRDTAVIELLDARVRITVASDTDRAVLAMVLDMLDRRGR